MPREQTVILGVDLAWGRVQRDAIVRINRVGRQISFADFHYLQGDDEFLEYVRSLRAEQEVRRVILAIDAPTLCVNEQGSRTVDRECSALFRQFEAGCHPVNLGLVKRPLELAKKLQKEGVAISSDLDARGDLMMEVYPHPAMVNWFSLEKTIKYKRGSVEARRREFHRYQQLFVSFLQKEFPSLKLPDELAIQTWTKQREDLLDASLCAVIGLWHLHYDGKKSQILGDLTTGQMVIPKRSRQ